MNFRRNLRRNNSGIGTIFGMVFFLLIVVVVFASFVIILTQNTGLEQTTTQAKQLDLDRYTELTTVFITNPQIAVTNSQVYISCKITNTGTIPTELVRLWIKDNTTDTVGNTKISPSVILQPGSSTQYFNFSYVVNSHPSDLFSFWFITTRGNAISGYPSTNQLNILPPVGTFPGVTDMNSTYQTNLNDPLRLSINTTKPNQLIYVVVSYDDGNTLYTPTSTPVLTWTLRGTSLPTDGSQSYLTYGHSGDSILETFYAIAPSAGPVTINIHSTADELSDYYCSALGFAISDVNTTSPFDGSAQTTIGQSSMPQDTITTHYSNDLVIGALGIDDLNPAITPGTGFGQIMPVQSSFGASGEPNSMPRSVWSEWAIAGDPRTNLSANCTFASSDDWAIIVDAVRLVVIPPVTPVSVSPNSGPIGQQVTVAGQGFAANSPLIAIFDGSQTSFSATTDSSGKIPPNAQFTVPIGSTAGNKTVTIIDSNFNYANTTFLVTTSNISVSPTNGSIGTTVTVTGSNFVDNSNINMNFDGNPTVTSPSSIVADASGSFSATFIFSFNDSAGTKQIAANDGFNSAFANFAVTPAITINPTNGPIGSLVNVTGSGFAATQPVAIKFAGATVVTIPANLNTDNYGFFSASFVVPTGQMAGGKNINASDATLNSATSTFAITPSIFLSPSSGNVGSTVTISGSGFAGNSALTAKFAGSTITLGGTINTNSSGGFTGATFTVPTWVPTWATGSVQTVNITDASSNSGSNTYTVNTVSQSITVTISNSAPNATVTVNGGNAIPNTFAANGNSNSITMFAGASFTLSFSNSGNIRNGFIVTSAFSSTSSSYTASTTSLSVTAYNQVQNTFSVSGVSGTDSVVLTGTYLGTASSNIVTLNSSNIWSAQAWSDYSTAVTFSVSTVNSGLSERWSIGNAYSTTALTVGGNTYSQTYIHQYKLTFAQLGLDNSATGTVTTVNGSAQTFNNLPYTTAWINSGSTVTYNYNNPITSSTTGKQFRLNSITGSASPITVNSPATITGNYVVQWQVTFTQTGIDSSAVSNTVLTVGLTNYAYNGLPSSVYVDNGTVFSWVSPVSGGTGKQFVQNGSSGSSPISTTGTYSATYKTQWLVTFAQSGLSSDATGTVATIAGATKTYSDLPLTVWVDASSGSVTYSYTSTVTSSTTGKQYVKTSTDSSPVTGLSGPLTVTGAYKIQWLVTFAQSGLDSSATGTVLTIGSTTYTYSQLPQTNLWVDSGTTYSYSTSVQAGTSKTFGYTSVTGLTSPITASGTVTGKYGSLILRPNAAGTTTGLSVNTGSNYAAVDEVSSDSDTTYVYRASATAAFDTYNIPDTSLSGLTIQSITVHIVAKEQSSAYGGYARPYIRIGSTGYSPSSYNSLTTSYVEYTNTWTTNPNTSAAWTWANINSLEIGAQMYSYSTSYYARCTQVWVEITYTA